MNLKCVRCQQTVEFAWEYEYDKCPPCLVESSIMAEVAIGQSVLDVGAGLGRYHHALYTKTDGNLVLLDAHMPNMVAHNPPPGSTLFVGDASVILPALRDQIFDVVMAIDVVEHLEKPAALDLIAQMQRVAERRVIVFTPDGFIPQEKDHYNLGGDHWQTHRSGWTADELVHMGFVVQTWRGFHTSQDGALFATWIRP